MASLLDIGKNLKNRANPIIQGILDSTDMDERASQYFRPKTGTLATQGRQAIQSIARRPIPQQLQSTNRAMGSILQSRNPLIATPRGIARGTLRGGTFGFVRTPQFTQPTRAENAGDLAGSLVGSMASFGKITKPLEGIGKAGLAASRLRNVGLAQKAIPALTRELGQSAAWVGGSKLGGEKVNFKKDLATGIGMSAIGGARGIKGFGKGMDQGYQAKGKMMHPDDVKRLDSAINMFNHLKAEKGGNIYNVLEKDYKTAMQNIYDLANGYLTNKQIDEIVKKTGNDKDFANEVFKALQPKAKEVDYLFSMGITGKKPQSTVGGVTNSSISSPTIHKTGKIEAGSQRTPQQPIDPMGADNATPRVETQIVQPQSQVQSSDSILPQRGFAETVAENKKTPQELSEGLQDIRYSPKPMKESLDFADKLIKKNESEALSYAISNSDTNANATAVRLVEKYINEGRLAEARVLTEKVAPRFTKQGQEIQILSAYGRLTPTGAIRYAQQIVNEANKANPRLKLKLTDANTKLITEYAKAIKDLPEGSRARTVAIAKLMQSITDIVPSSMGQKMATIQTMSQLMNLKTAVRNILGNTIFTGMENVSDVFATGYDALTSVITGKRTKTFPSISAQAGGFIRGAKEGVEDVKLGIDTSGGMKTQFDIPTKTFTKGVLGNLEKALNLELRVPDRAAYTAAFEGSLNNQLRAANVKSPTPEMLEIAHADGLYRTFQDNSRLAEIFTGVKKLLNKVGTPDGKFGLGDFVLKYPKTPANILARGLDYSPVGYVKGVYEAARPTITGQPFNQKQFVEALSRASAGTGLIATGYLLANNGIISGKPEKDYDINAVQKTTGQGAFKINVDALKRYWLSGGQKQDAQNGDTLVSYDWAQPTSLSIAMGANQALGNKFTDGINAAVDSYQSAVDTITGQPMVKGLVDFASGVKNKGVVGASTDAVLGSVSGFVPSTVRQTANAMDTTQRSTYNPSKVKETTNKVQSNIPVLRNQLEPKVDVFGKEMVNYEGQGLQRLFDIFVNPAFVTKVQENPAAKEVLDIYQRSGETQQAPRIADEKVKINGVDMQLSPKQYTEYQKYVGTKTDELFNTIVADPIFQQSTDEEKAKFLSNAMTDINSAAKIELFSNQPKTTTGNTKWLLSGGKFGGVSINEDGNLKLTPGSGGGTMSDYSVVSYNGEIKAIDMNRIVNIPKEPMTTGFEELDKEMASTYKSELSSIVNDVRILYESGQMTEAEAAAKMKEINDVYVGVNAKGKKPKKISIKKSKSTPYKLAKSKKIKFSQKKLSKPKITKTKGYRILTYTDNSPKVKTSKPVVRWS